MTEEAALRLDKWLWRARFFKTRSLAARVVADGVRVNGARVTKPGATVRPGDALTFTQARRVRVVRVLGLGERRGPAAEAAALYEDLDPPADGPGRDPARAPDRDPAAAAGRPSARDRRALAALKTGGG